MSQHFLTPEQAAHAEAQGLVIGDVDRVTASGVRVVTYWHGRDLVQLDRLSARGLCLRTARRAADGHWLYTDLDNSLPTRLTREEAVTAIYTLEGR